MSTTPLLHHFPHPNTKHFFYSLGGDLELEDQKFAAYLEANGWNGHVGADEALVSRDSEKGASVEL